MDIRTKLALALVMTALASMFLLGTFAYEVASGLLREVSERQLNALAESKHSDLVKVVAGWRERVELVRSRTRLRKLVAKIGSGVGSAAREREATEELRLILEDAVASVRGLERVTVYDFEGDALVTVGRAGIPEALDPRAFEDASTVHFGGTYVVEDDRVLVRHSGALVRDGRTVGVIETITDVLDLATVTQDYTGLGETGETIVVVESGDDAALVLSPLRHDRRLRHIILESSPYLRAALDGGAEIFRTGVRDYRDEEVWCATRTIDEVGWGIVVKIDIAEEEKRANFLRAQMLDLGLAIGALAILGGTLLGLWLGRPIRELKELVERVREGETDARAEISTRDEVGFLAEAVNELLDEQQGVGR